MAALTLVAGSTTAIAAPTGTVSFDGYASAAGVPSGLHTRLTLDAIGGSVPLLRSLAIDLPTGFTIGAQVASRPGGLERCSAEAFALGAARAARCPANAAVGTVRVAPADGGQPLDGTMFLTDPVGSGQLPGLAIEASVGGSSYPGDARMKLIGALRAEDGGRLLLRFDEIPQPAFRALELTFSGGSDALLTSPIACGAAAGLVTFTAATDGSTASAAAPIMIGPDCLAGQIGGSVNVSSADPSAGAWSTVTARVGIDDRTPALTTVRIALPSGLLAQIGAVPECTMAAAYSGTCGAQARLGEATLLVGAGPSPATATGAIFLVGRSAGAAAGLAAVVDLRFGGLDLGRVVMPGHLFLRPTDAGMNLQLEVPASAAGVPLRVRGISLALDRREFAINPSSCGPLAYGAALTGVTGSPATIGGAAAYAGCALRPFVPTLSAELSGEIQPLGHPSVTVSLSARAGDTNLQGATVTLPKGVAADLANLQHACPQATFEATACSAVARVGTATAKVALTPDPIAGDLYLVRIDGQVLPGLGLSFTGRYAQRVLSTVKVASDGRLVVRFDALPDLPLRRLDLTVTGGAGGPIRIAGGACAEGRVWDAAFRGQGGQLSSHTIAALCPARVARRAAITLSSRQGLSVRLTDLGGRALRSMKVSMPGGFVVDRSRASRSRFRQLSLDGAGSGVVRTTRTSVQVIPASRSTTKLTLRLGPGTIRRTGRSRAARTVTVPVRLAFTDGTIQRQQIRLRAS